MKSITILGVKITSGTKREILEYFFNRIKTPHTKSVIITPNPEMIVYANSHPDYKDKLNNADIALPDGVGLFFASGFKGLSLKERITGVDFIEELCEASREKPISMGFLGGRDGVAERTAKCLKEKYPWVTVAFVGENWPSQGFMINDLRFMNENDKRDKKNHNSYIMNHKSIDVLFVAYGVPKQEEWIFANIEKLPVKAAMGVGGAFDFISGAVPRAPLVLRLIGLEWLFRLIIQPWRWKRQLALLTFIKMVLMG